MSSLERLAPDQRAVVSLVLQQGRSYDEIASLLGIPATDVSRRAHAGLAALAPEPGLPSDVTVRLADFLLGQLPPGDAGATRELLAGSAPARRWATAVATRLQELAAAPLPGIPSSDDEPPPPASRLGGLLLIGAVLAVVGVVLFVALSGGSADTEPAASTPAATVTPEPEAAPAALQVADTIPLRAVGGGEATGTMTVYLQGEAQLFFELMAENVPPSGDRAAYAVWLTGPGARARRLGFAEPVGPDGRLGIQGPSQADLERFPRLYATFANVVVARETTEDAERPSQVLLTGELPRAR